MTEPTSEDRSEEILALCDAWVTAVTSEGTGFRLGTDSEQHRLRNHGIYPHQLTYPELRAALVGLTRVLLLPGLSTVVDWDHQHFWAWCGELLTGQGAAFFTQDEREIAQLLGLACRTSLAGITSPNHDGFEQARQRREATEANAQCLIDGSHNVLVYLSFPLLEAITKRACRAYVGYDGSVTETFTVASRSYTMGERISSLRDLLWLLHDDVADPELVETLDAQRTHLAGLDPNRDPFQMIYDWRNQSLHGETSLGTIGGTVFTTALLIALDNMSRTYEGRKAVAIANVQREAQLRQLGYPTRSPWSYYPPYWEDSGPPVTSGEDSGETV